MPACLGPKKALPWILPFALLELNPEFLIFPSTSRTGLVILNSVTILALGSCPQAMASLYQRSLSAPVLALIS